MTKQIPETASIQIELKSIGSGEENLPLEQAVFEFDEQIDGLSSQADATDYLVAASSGLLCAMLDVLWVGGFDLRQGRDIASEQVESAVIRLAQATGCKKQDLNSCVRHLEDLAPLAADGNTRDFGGGLQHHLRDFAHHPTVFGLAFSIVSQFTGMSYGTNTAGEFICVPIPEASLKYLHDDPASKIIYGTMDWFLHLASDMAGSNSTAGLSGGTGIPGPILSLAKELSATPLFHELQVGGVPVSVFISKLFNGTLLAEHDADGRIIKGTELRMDLRGELGVCIELLRQALPVLANECIVRTFYLLRHLVVALREQPVRTLDDLGKLDKKDILPADNPSITRMLTVSSAVFTAVDVADAVASGGYWLSVNYVGVVRLGLAIKQEAAWMLKRKDVERIRRLYKEMQFNTYGKLDDNIYIRIGNDMAGNADFEHFGLTREQTEILYNLERMKTLDDIAAAKGQAGSGAIRALKRQWLMEWQKCMDENFAAFTGIDGARIKWCTSPDELVQRIEAEAPEGTWFRIVLLEAMIFEPYFALSFEEDRHGKAVPSKSYDELKSPLKGYSESNGDSFLHLLFGNKPYYPHDEKNPDYIKRLRRSYNKALRELNEVQKTVFTSVLVAAGIMLATVTVAGMFAGSIAVALVGSNFAGLSGAALTSACLAYLGGGAVAVGGAGMAGGTVAIVGGGAVLGLGAGGAVGGALGAAELCDKKETILQSAKLIVSVREIFLNDEGDVEYSTTVYEQYTQNIQDIETDLVKLKLQADDAPDEEKKELQQKIKQAEETVEAMKRARKSLGRFISSYKTGLAAEDGPAQAV